MGASGELVTVEARCMGKDSDQQGAISKWEFVGGDTITIPDDEGKPGLEVELPTGSDPQCRCNPINIPDGFLEPGAHVMCEKGVREEMTITSDDHCVLFCDGHVVLEVQCLAGVWTDAVEDYCDFWCWRQPEDDCGTTTPTATPTETPTPTSPTSPTPTSESP